MPFIHRTLFNNMSYPIIIRSPPQYVSASHHMHLVPPWFRTVFQLVYRPLSTILLIFLCSFHSLHRIELVQGTWLVHVLVPSLNPSPSIVYVGICFNQRQLWYYLRQTPSRYGGCAVAVRRCSSCCSCSMSVPRVPTHQASGSLGAGGPCRG